MKKIPKIRFQKRPETISGFELLSLEELFTRPMEQEHDPFQTHRLSFFAILIITKGTVNHQVDFSSYSLKPDTCLIISKGQVHAFNRESKYHGYIVLFTEEFLLKFVSPSSISKISSLYNYHLTSRYFHNPEGNQHFIDQIQREINSGKQYAKEDVLGNYLSLFLLQLERANQSELFNHNFDRGYELFRRFKNLVEQRYPINRNARYFAHELGISYKHLNEVCKKLTQKTAKAFIDDYVILEVKRYLATTPLSAKEISYECGFDEPTNFLKYFKNKAGMTPTSFKRSIA